MINQGRNYSDSDDSIENFNSDDRYDNTGESEFSRESTIPFDEDEVLSERHYLFGSNLHGKERLRIKEHSRLDLRGRGPKGYKKSDEAIKEDICEALYRSSEVDASEIEVFVSNGHATLKGTVPNRFQKKQAERTIEHISGVYDIYNELHIKKGNESKKGALIQNRTGMN